MGLSLGGAVAIDFALSHPQRVMSIIPIATSALGGYPWHETLDRWFGTISAAAAGGDINQAKELWLSSPWFAPAMAKPKVAAKLRDIAEGYSGWHFANKNPVERLQPPANGRLASIAVPSLVVTGGLDLPFYNLPIGERLASQIPGARHVVLSGAGHMANMEEPQAFNRAVLQFLATVDPS
jgi:pimeloyl-ACP methyl ester carboxylesterase